MTYEKVLLTPPSAIRVLPSWCLWVVFWDPADLTNRFYVKNWVYKGLVDFLYVRCLPPLYICPLFTPIYRGGKQRTRFFLMLPLYVPNFTLISDLTSDLGAIRQFCWDIAYLSIWPVNGQNGFGAGFFKNILFSTQTPLIYGLIYHNRTSARRVGRMPASVATRKYAILLATNSTWGRVVLFSSQTLRRLYIE